jgi:biopolymer transport protein ExbD
MRRPGGLLARRPRRARGSDDDRILPLVNIVFLLLIFFMVAGELTRADPFDIAPPRSASEGAAPEGPPLVLAGAGGRLALDGAQMARPALLAALPGRLGAEGRLRLKVDGRAEAARIVALLAALKAAGARDIRLLTVPEGP